MNIKFETLETEDRYNDSMVELMAIAPTIGRRVSDDVATIRATENRIFANITMDMLVAYLNGSIETARVLGSNGLKDVLYNVWSPLVWAEFD